MTSIPFLLGLAFRLVGQHFNKLLLLLRKKQTLIEHHDMVSNCSKNVLSERILFKNIYLGFFFLSIEGEFLFHGLLSSV